MTWEVDVSVSEENDKGLVALKYSVEDMISTTRLHCQVTDFSGDSIPCTFTQRADYHDFERSREMLYSRA
jgi:hypothetical protein